MTNWSMGDRESLDKWPFDILNPEHRESLREALSHFDPAVVFVDTLRESHRGDENDSTDMQNVISQLTAAVNPAAMVLVAHGKKSNPEYGPNLINDNRGSNYVVSKMDSIIHLTPKLMQVGGRACEEQTIHLDRTDDQLWSLSGRDQAKLLARELLNDSAYPTLRDKARRLADLTGKPEETCKSILLRLGN